MAYLLTLELRAVLKVAYCFEFLKVGALLLSCAANVGQDVASVSRVAPAGRAIVPGGVVVALRNSRRGEEQSRGYGNNLVGELHLEKSCG